MMRKKLIEVFPNWLTGGGIFTALQSLNVPWVDDGIAQELDTVYYGSHSGDKNISPLIDKVMDGDSLTSGEITTLAQSALAIYNKNWSKLWDTLTFEYDPIENYRMTETGEDDTVDTYGKTHTRTDNLTHGKTGTDTNTLNLTDTRTDNLTHGKIGTDTNTLNLTDSRTDDLTHGKTGTDTLTLNTEVLTTPDLQNDTTNEVYGFDSNSAVPSGEQHTSATGTNTVENTGTETTAYNTSETDTGTQTTTHTGTDATAYDTTETDTGTQTTTHTGTDATTYGATETDTGTQTDADTGTDSRNLQHTLTRYGNIGVTTSQQMIQAERDLWMWNFFNNVVFKDMDNLLTIAIY